MSAPADAFSFKLGDLVLVKWLDNMVYFAKIKKIDQRRRKCIVVFDDKSHDEADFDQIHSVDETTTDIICIKCKRDDSDSPNEIVLCDTCGIGYHQRCHIPPIPASALEIDTPWNCAYCLKGVKCPFLTESLDVLQNLLSEDEAHSHDEVDSVTTMESDDGGEEFNQHHPQHLSPPKPPNVPQPKKRGRKPKVRRGPKPSPQKRTVSRSPNADAWKLKLAAPSHSSPSNSTKMATNSEFVPSPSSMSSETSEPQKRKRPQFVTMKKRPRKSSVLSQTLSVTRISVPVHEESPKSDSSEQAVIHESPALSKTDSFLTSSEKSPPKNNDSQKSTPEEPLPAKAQPPEEEKKPRSLRVSLNLPEEVEPGSPLEKVVKGHKLLSPKFAINTLPPWEDTPGPPVTASTTRVITSSDAAFNHSPAPSQVPAVSQSNGHDIQSMQLDPPTIATSPRSKEHRQEMNISSPHAQDSTAKSTAQLTPFTASALPFPVSSTEAVGRKRRNQEEVDSAQTTLPPPKKVSLSHVSPPVSPSDDVFETPTASSTASTGNTTGSTVPRYSTQPHPQPQPQPIQPQPQPQPQPLGIQHGVVVTTKPTAAGTTKLRKILPKPSLVNLVQSPNANTFMQETPVGYGASNAALNTTVLSSKSEARGMPKVITAQATTPDKTHLNPRTTLSITAAPTQGTAHSVQAKTTPASVKTVSVLQHAKPSLPTSPMVAEKNTISSQPRPLEKMTIPSQAQGSPVPVQPVPLGRKAQSQIPSTAVPDKQPVHLQPTVPAQLRPPERLTTTAPNLTPSMLDKQPVHLQPTVPAQLRPPQRLTTTAPNLTPSPVVSSKLVNAVPKQLQPASTSAIIQSSMQSHSPPEQPLLPQAAPQGPTVIAPPPQRQQAATTPVIHPPTNPAQRTVMPSPTTRPSQTATQTHTHTAQVAVARAAAHGRAIAPGRVNASLPSQTHAHSLAKNTALLSPLTGTNTTPQSATTTPMTTPMTTPSSSFPSLSHTRPRDQVVVTSTAASSDNDIMITNIEGKNQSNNNHVNKPLRSLPSYTEALHCKLGSSTSAVVQTTTTTTTVAVPAAPHSSLKGRPQELYTGRMSDLKGSRRVAVDIQPSPVPAPPKAVPVVRSHAQQGPQPREQGTGSIVMPISNQTPVSMVPLVVTPTAYTQSPAQDGATYLIPAGNVGQGGQQVAYAIPAGQTAMVMPQGSQQAAVQYVLETVAPTTPPTSVLHTRKAGTPAIEASVPVVAKNLQQKSVYHMQAPPQTINGKTTPPIAAAKTYAIVPAQPTTPLEIHSIAVDQGGVPVVNQPLPAQYSVVPGTQYIQAAITPPVDHSHTTSKPVAIPMVKNHASVPGSTHQVRAPVTSIAGKPDNAPATRVYHHHPEDEDVTSISAPVPPNLNEIGKKIGDAFANCSEEMLIAAFEDAWKKFQANGKKYEALTLKSRNSKVFVGKPTIPPNAEVVSVPGASSRLSLVRPTYSRPKLVPKPSADQVIVSDPQPSPAVAQQPPQQQQQQQVQYIYSYAPNTSQPQLYIQPVSSDYAIYTISPNNAQHPQAQAHPHPQAPHVQPQTLVQPQGQIQGQAAPKTYQVQTSGVFIPAHATERDLNGSPVVVQSVPVLGSPQPVPSAPKQAPRVQKNMPERSQAVEQAHPVQHHTVVRKVRTEAGVYPLKPREPVTKPTRQCALCDKEATYLCSGCRGVWYCGKDCQLKAWDEHSEHCKA